MQSVIKYFQFNSKLQKEKSEAWKRIATKSGSQVPLLKTQKRGGGGGHRNSYSYRSVCC